MNNNYSNIFYSFVPGATLDTYVHTLHWSGAPEHFEFWRGKTSKGAHLSEILGEGAKRPSGGRVWEGGMEGGIPPPTVGTFSKIRV